MSAHADAPAYHPGRDTLPHHRRSTIRPRVTTRESLRFLAEVGNALASSLDYPSTLQNVAELTVPRLACYCELDLIERGRIRRVGIAHRDPSKYEALGRQVILPPQAEPSGVLAGVLESGTSLLLTNDLAGDGGKDWRPDPLDLLRLTGATSLLLVPLIARDRTLGVLLLASTRTDRSYGPADLILAEEVARISALAIDNARLYFEAKQAIRAREDILRVVSHDLRNPIGAMASAASVVLQSSSSEHADGPTHRLLRTIVRASDQASRMIDDLFDLARIDSDRLTVDTKPESLTPIIAEAVDMHTPLATQRSIHLRYESSEPSPIVLVDRRRLLQLLGNLLSNAIRFTPADGKIDISVAVQGGEARCTVVDTGVGIHPDQLPHVFDRFWQGARGDRAGLGLGLAIVRAIADAHGGRITVESEPGRGTTFALTLPLAGTAVSREASRV